MSVSPEQFAEFRQTRYNGTVTHLDLLHTDLMVLRVKPDFPRPQYQAGQYTTLGLGNFELRAEGCQDEDLKPEDLLKLVRRSYSISSSVLREDDTLRDPATDDWLEFYIVLVRENPDGRTPALTPRLFRLTAGSRLNIGEKITGHFNLDPVKPGDNVVFLGTGTGEAPHNAMLGELLLKGHTGRILNACCVRFARDLGYRDIHARLMARYPNYKYLPLTTRENLGVGKVYIQDLIASGELEHHLGTKLDPATTHVFLCGNPKMIGIPAKNKETGTWEFPKPVGAIEELAKLGFTADNPALKVDGNVHFEKYW